MTKLYQILIWLSSVGVLTCFVKMYVLMFLVMSVIIVLSSKFIGKSLSKAVVITDIAVLVSAFVEEFVGIDPSFGLFCICIFCNIFDYKPIS